MNRIILIIIVSILMENHGLTQFGMQFSIGENYFQESTKSPAINPANSSHFALGPSYWFRLKSKRIEFNPAIIFDYSHSNYLTNDFGFHSLSEYNLTFTFPILIYPLDFGSDCHCPTFNKSGQFFEKGFYFLIYPSIPYSIKKISGDLTSFKKNVTGFQLGLAAGVDIGLSKKWTLSPAVMVSKIFRDAYSLIPDQSKLNEDGDSRYRIDLLIRLIWFDKNSRN